MTWNPRCDLAFAYASSTHRLQRRKGGCCPAFITHLMSVAALVSEAGGSQDATIAALLHDAVEDQGGMECLEGIRRLFGDHVAEIVLGCSDSTVDTNTQEKLPWLERKERYLAHLALASPDVLLVSCADKLHNVRCLVSEVEIEGVEHFDRFQGKKDGTLWYYRECLKAFESSQDVPARLLKPLRREIEMLTVLASEGGVS